MSQSLVPCPACRRHVVASETACPFCDAALPASLADKVIPGMNVRVKRAVAFALGASLGMAGCSTSVQAIYGAPVPPVDANADVTDGASHDVPEDFGSIVVPYGVPVRTDVPTTDATDATASDVADAGNFFGAYGSPAPVDGGDR